VNGTDNSGSTSLGPPEREALLASKGKRLRPSVDPNIPQAGRVFYSGQWRTPEQIETQRLRSLLCPYMDPSTPYPGRIFWGGRWRTEEQIERNKNHTRDLQRKRERARVYRAQPHIQAERSLNKLFEIRIRF
jgi:hypothetical protein